MSLKKYNKISSSGTRRNSQVSAKADKEITEEYDCTHLKTYSAQIMLEFPAFPSPRTATTRMIGDEFVWERLFQTKGRGKAVEKAGDWFRDVKTKDYGKFLKNAETHECVIVDDPWEECSFGSEFRPTRSVNRLLDKETIKRVLEESKGLLKASDRLFEVGKSNPHPSLEWRDENIRKNHVHQTDGR